MAGLGSCQTIIKWYLTRLCLTPSIIRYLSLVRWTSPGNGIAPPLHIYVLAIKMEPSGRPHFWSPNYV